MHSSRITTPVPSSPAIPAGRGCPPYGGGSCPGRGPRSVSDEGRLEVPPLGDFSGRCRRNLPAARGNLLSWARQAGSHPSQAGSFLSRFMKLPHPLPPGRKDARTATWPDVTPARVWGGVWGVSREASPSLTSVQGPEPGQGSCSSSSGRGLGRGQPDSLQRPVPRVGVVVAGGLRGPSLGQQRTLALCWLLPQECQKKEAIWVTREAAGCCPRAQPVCGGLRDWSPPPSPQVLARGSHLFRFTQLRTGVS